MTVVVRRWEGVDLRPSCQKDRHRESEKDTEWIHREREREGQKQRETETDGGKLL